MRIHHLSRPKFPVRHHGVAVAAFEGAPQVVYDLTPHGFGEQSLEEFADGHLVHWEATLDDYFDVQAAYERLLEVGRNPQRYHLLGYNCEHLTRYIMYGERKSPQVAGIATLGGLLAIGLLLSRR